MNSLEKEKSEKHCFFNKTNTVVCILLNMIFTVSFLLFIIVWAVKGTTLNIPNVSSMCIPCEDQDDSAYKTTSLSDATVIMRESKNGVCCGPYGLKAIFLLQKEMTVQYYEYSRSSRSLLDILDEYAACERETNNKQPIAKVIGIVKFKPSFIIEGHAMVLWNKNGRTFSANNLIHLELEGEIFVRQPGYYIVSSRLNLRHQKETLALRNETRPTTFMHSVNLLSHKYGTVGVLMQTEKSIERNSVNYTSFLSAVFKLDDTDRLSVSVSHPKLLAVDNPNDEFLVYYTYDLPY